ncbi:hypothetical protein [Mannheimia granulomatis]|nr:hypothetical protein [Mannheimia granulomatis]
MKRLFLFLLFLSHTTWAETYLNLAYAISSIEKEGVVGGELSGLSIEN